MISLVDLITCRCMAKPHMAVCHIEATPEPLAESDESSESGESGESSRSLGDALDVLDALSVQGIPSWNSFESWTCPRDMDHPRQPNRLVHEYKTKQIRGSLQKHQEKKSALKKKVREARGEAEGSFAWRWMVGARWNQAGQRQDML